MTTAHHALAWVVVGATGALLAAAVWSWTTGRRSGGRADHRFAVDRLVLVVEAAVVVAAGAGGVVLLGGARPADPLHLLYGALGVAAVPLGLALGGRGAGDPGPSRRRRDRWIAISAAVLLAIELRLFLTG